MIEVGDNEIRFLFEDAWYAMEHMKNAYLYHQRELPRLRNEQLTKFKREIDMLCESLQGFDIKVNEK